MDEIQPQQITPPTVPAPTLVQNTAQVQVQAPIPAPTAAPTLAPTPTAQTPIASMPPETPSNSKKLPLIIIGIVIIAGLAAAAYFTMGGSEPGGSNGGSNDNTSAPPSLSLKIDGAKGSFVEKDMNLLKFEQSDLAPFKTREVKFKTDKVAAIKLKAGINYIYAEKEISFEDVVNAIDPLAGRMAVTFYDTNAKKFLIYPKGPFDGTQEVKQVDTGKTKIPAGYGFVVMAEREANLYGAKFGTEKSALLTSSLDDKKNGWQLIAANDSSILNIIKPIQDKSRVSFLFAQKGDTEFEEAKDINYKLSHYLLWIKLDPPKVASANPVNPATQTAADPEVTSVTPNTAKQGESTTIVITGKNLTGTSTSFSDKDITLDGSPTITADKITLKIKIAATATTTGTKKIIISKDAKKIEKDFTVTAATPTSDKTSTSTPTAAEATEIDPTEATQGETKDITITGKNLQGATVKLEKEDTGITIKSQKVATDGNSIDLKIDLTDTATPGAVNFTITPASSASDSTTPPTPIKIAFNVNKKVAAKIEPKIEPNEAEKGETDKEIKITGTNMQGATIEVENEDIKIKKSTIKIAEDGSYITFAINITNEETAVGPTKFIVTPKKSSSTTGDTTPIEFEFTVKQKATVTKIDPAEAMQGSKKNIVITGTNLQGAAVEVENEDIAIKESTIKIAKDGSSIKFEINIFDTQTALGPTKFKVTPSGSASNADTPMEIDFTVKPKAAAGTTDNGTTGTPTITAIMPNSGEPGKTINVTITGTNFTGATEVFIASKSTTSDIKVNAAGTEITATIAIDAGEPVGIKNVNVITPHGSIAQGLFEIKIPSAANATPPAQAALSSIEWETLAPGSVLDGAKKTGFMAMGYNPKFWLCVTNLTDTKTPFTIESSDSKLVFSDVKIDTYTGGTFGMSSYCGQGGFSGVTGGISGDPKTAISATLKVPQDIAEKEYTITLKQGTATIGSKILTIKKPAPQAAQPAPAQAAQPAPAKNVLAEVDSDEWVKGTIDKENTDGTYQVTYKVAGVEKKGVTEEKENLALFDQHPSEVKMYQSAIRYNSSTQRYWGAIVKKINSDGTVNIQYKDKKGGDDKNGNVKNVNISKEIWMSMAGEDSKKTRIARDLENLVIVNNASDSDKKKKDYANPTFTINGAQLQLIELTDEYQGVIIPLKVKISSGPESGEYPAIIKGKESEHAENLNMLAYGGTPCLYWASEKCNKNGLSGTSIATTLFSLKIGTDFKVIIYYDTYTKVVEKQWKV